MHDSAALRAGSAEPITVFLLEDHDIVRRGITELLEAADDIIVIGQAATVDRALMRIPALRPEVAILDARLPDGSGIEVCRDIRAGLPNTHCIILTSYDDDAAVLAAIMAGASGYLLKEIRGAALVDAVRQVAAGKSLLDPAVTRHVLDRLQNRAPEDARLASLSPREREVLSLITDGVTNRQIGESLQLSEKTVRNYVSSLLAKLGMTNRTQAAVFSAQARADGPTVGLSPHDLAG